MEKKNIQVYLSIFFLHFFFQSGALKEGRSQSLLFSKRSFEGRAKSIHFFFQSGALKEASGDVGAKITSGSHNITRNILEEIKELRGDKIKISS